MASARAQRADLAERHPSHAQRRRQARDATLLVISMHPSWNYSFLEELYGAPDACIRDRAGGGVSEGPAHRRVLLCTDDGAGSCDGESASRASGRSSRRDSEAAPCARGRAVSTG